MASPATPNHLREALPARFVDLIAVLAEFRIDVNEPTRGGGSWSQTIRFDGLLHQRGWGKRNVTIAKLIDDTMIHSTRGHEIDMFGAGSPGRPYPGVAVEMEWNNTDPFFDRDLVNFAALHREGALAIGVIVTRGPTLQKYIGPVITTGQHVTSKKYGTSTDQSDKLISSNQPGWRWGVPLARRRYRAERIDGFQRVINAQPITPYPLVNVHDS